MQIIDYKEIENNFCKIPTVANPIKLAKLTIMIPKWGDFIIREIILFDNGKKKWVSLPTYLAFKDYLVQDAFRDRILDLLSPYLGCKRKELQYDMFNRLDTSDNAAIAESAGALDKEAQTQ